MDVSVEIRRGNARFADRAAGRATWHGFSFGPHYDPERLSFGPMVCHDEHLLGDGQGFETHPHRDLDIVTWVVSGALRHADSLGGETTLEPGSVGLLRAGGGVQHSEVAAAPQTRFVQVWLTPADPEQAPSYAVLPAPAGDGHFAPVLEVGQGRTMYAARLAAGQSVTVPVAGLRHLFVTTGALTRSSLAEPLAAGDALLLGEPAEVAPLTAAVDTELVLWAFDAEEEAPQR